MFETLEQVDIIICIYGCVTVEKYKKQIEMINQTWGRQCNGNIKLLYFLGEEMVEGFDDSKYIYLPNILNDYLSASYKQFLGLKYIIQHYNFKYVFCCGTDTYINIPKLIQLSNEFDSEKSLYIGGHGCHRTIDGFSYYFHSGGPGFLLSYNGLNQLYPLLDGLMDDWKIVCDRNNIIETMYAACDTAISYYLQKITNTEIIKVDGFSHCNYCGYPCHPGQIDITKIISCHLMSFEDFIVFTKILEDNNYFL